MKRPSKSGMPSPEEMAGKARVLVAEKWSARKLRFEDSACLKLHFDEAIADLLEAEYGLFLTEERKIKSAQIQAVFESLFKGKSSVTREELNRCIEQNFSRIDSMFLSFAQSRKSRAGGSFENHVRFLLRALDYPFDEQQVINGKPDFLLPGVALYRKQPGDCVLLTIKRKLRERWRQIVTEGVKASGFFLATIDNDISKSTLHEMSGHKIYLVIPEAIIQDNALYRATSNVLSFSRFFKLYVDPAMVRWHEMGHLKSDK